MNKNKELSLRGAVGDVAIACDKALSSRGRAESSDVVISCDKVLMNIRNHYCMSHLFSEIAASPTAPRNDTTLFATSAFHASSQ